MAEKFKISNLDLYYGDFHALKNINLDIKEKESEILHVMFL